MTLTDGGAQPELAVPASATRWRRYGHDRFYVSGPGGERLGYRDLAAGTDHPASPQHASVVKTTADKCVRTQPAAVPAKLPTAPEPPERTWTDLTPNLPGAALRERASTEPAAAVRIRALSRGLKDPADERSWLLGADGEDRVADRLVRIHRKHPAWTAIHGIRVGKRGADIDHLLIGPGGIFTVNTKCHPEGKLWVRGDAFWVNGQSTRYVPKARYEASRASSLLSAAVGEHIHVEGLIVPVLSRVCSIKTPPGAGVHVVTYGELVRWVLNLPSVLSQERLNRIWEMARRSTTWQR